MSHVKQLVLDKEENLMQLAHGHAELAVFEGSGQVLVHLGALVVVQAGIDADEDSGRFAEPPRRVDNVLGIKERVDVEHAAVSDGQIHLPPENNK